MNRKLDTCGISISTNRGCNLSCHHCYIEPKLLKSNSTMTESTFIQVFENVESMILKGGKLNVVEWDVMGGEPTLMPFEWWEKMLPIAIHWVRRINKLTEGNGHLMFTTNMVFKDQRYIGLFNEMSKHDEFFVFTSYEADTNRFGTKWQHYSTFEKNVLSLNVRNLTLNLILTKSLCETPIEEIVNKIVKLGVTDVSLEQLSPFGSGKHFYDKNMADYGDMSAFIISLRGALPENITLSPYGDMEAAIQLGKTFCSNGMYKYDLSIEPDGLTTFNSCQTGKEKNALAGDLYITSPDWASSVILHNAAEEEAKLKQSHDYCSSCKFITHCNGGWYHGRDFALNDKVLYDTKDCSGLKMVWEHIYKEFNSESKIFIKRRDELSNFESLKHLLNEGLNDSINESEILRLPPSDMINTLAKYKKVNMDLISFTGSSPLSRILLYQNLNLIVSIDRHETKNVISNLNIVELLISSSIDEIDVEQEVIWSLLIRNKNNPMFERFFCVLSSMLNHLGHRGYRVSGFNICTLEHFHSGYIKWIMSNKPSKTTVDTLNVEPVSNVVRQPFLEQFQLDLDRRHSLIEAIKLIDVS